MSQDDPKVLGRRIVKRYRRKIIELESRLARCSDKADANQMEVSIMRLIVRRNIAMMRLGFFNNGEGDWSFQDPTPPNTLNQMVEQSKVGSEQKAIAILEMFLRRSNDDSPGRPSRIY